MTLIKKAPKLLRCPPRCVACRWVNEWNLQRTESEKFILQTASCKLELQLSFKLNSFCQLLRGNECWKMAKTFVQLGWKTFNCGSQLIWEVAEALIWVAHWTVWDGQPFVLNYILGGSFAVSKNKFRGWGKGVLINGLKLKMVDPVVKAAFFGQVVGKKCLPI